MKKKKIIIGIVIALAAVILLTPMPAIVVKDGGSRVYKALTYKVYKYHSLPPIILVDEDGNPVNGDPEYRDGLRGLRVEVLGIKVFDNFNDRYRELYGDRHFDDGEEYYLDGTGDFIPYFKYLFELIKGCRAGA